MVSVLREEVGDQLLGVYLHGSLAMGGFRPGASDVDVLVVASSFADPQGLGDALARLELPGPLELSVVEPHAGTRYLLHVAGDRVVTPDASRNTDPDLIPHVTAVLARGEVLAGRPPAELLDEPPWSAFLAAVADDFDWSAEHAPARYQVLNGCRFLASLSSPPGTVLSKDEGGAWGVERLPREHHTLIQRALADELGPSDADALRRFRTFVTGAAVRRRPGRKVAGLP